MSISEHQAWREELAGRERMAQSLARIESVIGRDALPNFLDTPQPDLEGMTGREALDHDPEAVFDALEADPVFDHLPQRQSSKKAARLLSILDELNREDRKR
jgi:hypothetical protein